MVKVIVGILSSDGYDNFKEIWIQNIKYIKSISDNFDFYFIYGGHNENLIVNEYYTDFYNDSIETIKNMAVKTLKFYKYIIDNCVFDFVLRTNLSTLFDFAKMNNWFLNIPQTTFLGGSIIANFANKNTMVSGVNTVCSYDIIKYLNNNFYKFSLIENEDVETSNIILNNISNINFKSVIRIDFLSDDEMLYHKCPESDNNIIFCFRFKSNNRYNDVKNMNNVFNKFIANDYNYSNNQFKIKSENPEMNMYSKSVFLINKN